MRIGLPANASGDRRSPSPAGRDRRSGSSCSRPADRPSPTRRLPGIPREGLQPIGVADARLRIGTVRIDDLDTAAAAGIDEFGRCARQVEDAAGDAHGDVSGRMENGAAVLRRVDVVEGAVLDVDLQILHRSADDDGTPHEIGEGAVAQRDGRELHGRLLADVDHSVRGGVAVVDDAVVDRDAADAVFRCGRTVQHQAGAVFTVEIHDAAAQRDLVDVHFAFSGIVYQILAIVDDVQVPEHETARSGSQHEIGEMNHRLFTLLTEEYDVVRLHDLGRKRILSGLEQQRVRGRGLLEGAAEIIPGCHLHDSCGSGIQREKAQERKGQKLQFFHLVVILGLVDSVNECP